MPTSPSSIKPLPHLPVLLKSPVPWMLDDDSQVHLWKLIQSWLKYGQLQTKWVSVINDILLRILETQLSELSSLSANEIMTSMPISIQLFETGSASQSKYLPGASHGTQMLLLTDLPLPSIYGGTVRLYGVPQSLQQMLIDIMAISLYTLYSLRLEMDLMQDHHVLLTTNLSQQDTSKSEPLMTTMNENGTFWRYSIFAWILGKRKDKETVMEKRRYSEKSFQSILSATINYASTKGRLSTMSSKTIPKKPVDTKIINNNIYLPDTLPAQHDSLGQQQYQQLRHDLECACISTSPSCIFTVPSIVTVLEKEEENMNTIKAIITNNQQRQEQQQLGTETQKQRLSDQSLRNKLTLLARRSSSILSHGSTTEQLKTSNTHTVFLPQYLTAYTMLRIPTNILNSTSKIGMDHLYLDGSSIEAFAHHQRITISYSSYTICCPERPCIGPILCTIQYFLFDDDQSPYTDQTLGDTLKRWIDQWDNSCKYRIGQQAQAQAQAHPRKKANGLPQSLNQNTNDQTPSVTLDNTRLDGTNQQQRQHPQSINTNVFLLQGCNQPLQDHILCFTHGSSCIQVYFMTTNVPHETTADDLDTIMNDDSNSNNNNNSNTRLKSWLECTICNARSPSTTISLATYLFSFGKYLELCLYSRRLNGPRDYICQHAKTSPFAIAQCFGKIVQIYQQEMGHYSTTKTIEIRFVKKGIQVYRLKGSPLQTVEPEELPSSSTTSQLCPRISNSTLEKWKIKEGMAVDDLFRSMQQHLIYLQEHQTDRQLEIDISNWRTKLELHHERLTLALKNCSAGAEISLNDFRRFFTMNASAIVDDWNGWQQSRWPFGQLFTWHGRPDYMNADMNQTIHCFPDSAIMVRETEPTSIIAYTLSSNDYIEELTCLQHLESNILDMASTETPLPVKRTTPSTNDSGNDSGKGSNTSNSDQLYVIDSYYSSVERKYISPTTGSTTETASFRTTVMETVKNNVNNPEQHTDRLPRWRHATFLSPSLTTIDMTTRLLRKTERGFDLSPYPSTTEIRQSAFYHSSDPAFSSNVSPYSLDNTTSTISSTNTSRHSSPSSTDDTSKTISPHIKHQFIHGNVEFTCVVYYAEQFESLRRSCGVDQLVIESLGRCQNWSTTGGKSKSRFYKTQDDRLVIKEMVNAWNIAERDAFLRFAPKYFEYLRKSDKVPTILAKIFGFYSITIRTLNDKKQTLNMDVLVMEQLFYGQSICKVFDFKGIPDRQVDDERKYQQDTTLWDNDWRKEYRLGHVTFDHSRHWLETAILHDTQFLASRNIMDYSLLVGIDNTKEELSVGIVDFIGAYTWYKKLESRSKSTINRNREVTVLPPDQYRVRFCREVLDYFVPIPGKFDNISLEQTNSSTWMK